MMRRLIEVWVCDECGQFYGATNAGNISEKMNTDHKNKPTFSRDSCPNCGPTVKRQWRYAVVLDFGPGDHVGTVNEEELVREAYRLLKGAGHESVG